MICNATPLICLSQIQQLHLLRRCFGTIIIPSAVQEEILIEDKPGFVALVAAFREGWIKVRDPQKMLELGLGRGEQATLSLAQELKSKLIIDDAVAIRAARALHLEVLRTTTVLFLGIQKKILTKKQALILLNKLIQVGYYIKPQYYAALLTKLNN